jgi:hypothetical protein
MIIHIDMEYHEEYTWPLTSSTTCYSGVRRIEHSQSSRTARLAIEWHACSLAFEGNSTPVFSWREISKSHEDSLVCVGHSASDQWECLALLDTSKLQTVAIPEQPGHSAPPATQQEASIRAADLDDQSVSASTTATQVENIHRRAAALESSGMQPQVHLISASSIDSEVPTGHQVESLASEPVAVLLLRKHPGTGIDDDSITVEFAATLDFRPLAPTICHIGSATPNSTVTAGIWLGSPDNNKLHCFIANAQNASLELKENEDPAFSFVSPIMAIDFLMIENDTKGHLNCLAVACQDGTIRTITFSHANGGFCNICHTQVIVDGPIVCIDLTVVKNTGFLLVTAGSLCGYVTELFVDPSTCASNGPYMVAEGLWNASLDSEDSVLTVQASGSTVLIGTFCGRVLLFVKDGSSQDGPGGQASREYRLHWYCQLPYSVHSVCFLDDARLLVTTRRSLHVFKPVVSGRFDPKIVAAKIKSKLQSRLDAWEEQQQKVAAVHVSDE